MKEFWSSSTLLLLFIFGVINSMGQGIRVESAFYGSRDGSGVDVTRRVQRFADYGEPFRVSNDTLRIDPAPGRAKALVIVYFVNGRRISQTVPEGEVFYFRNGRYADRDSDDYGPGFRVIRATYGTRGRYVDVTGRVRDLVRDRETFIVSNETFGVDPYQGQRKRLRLLYLRHGEEREREYPEGSSVKIW